jgi:wyosine [tRNA(Phe)-imidazoG37] synthetase (radical SAM superfamily)/GNAT superfamily N-acetyltransferase
MKYVFGPVPSRRLGRSLGVDPVPLKTCNWNCVYCQLGRSRPVINERREYYPAEAIVAEVDGALRRHEPGSIDWVTFVGSGEPLLHARMGWMLRQVKALTDIPVAVITNGSLLYEAEVREDLAAADTVLPSLDAGNADLYRRLNRAHPRITFERLVDGLVAFSREYRGKLWPEVMLVRGLNDTEEALREIAACLARVEPGEIHVNLPTRPPGEPWVKPPDDEGLMRAIAILEQVAPVRAAQFAEGTCDLGGFDGVTDAVVAVITRHPLAEADLLRTLARWTPDQVGDALAELEADGRAQVVTRHGTRFWTAAAAYFPNGGVTGAPMRTRRVVPQGYDRRVTLADGTPVLFRLIKPDDEPLWRDLFARCSRDSIRSRFGALIKRATDDMAKRYCFIDYDRELAIVAEVRDGEQRELVAVGRLITDPEHRRAEFAILIEDAWQGRGLGSRLTDYCLEIAEAWGLAEVYALTTPDNARMVNVFRGRGFKLMIDAKDGSIWAVRHFGTPLSAGPADVTRLRSDS